jgi:hypothetical protein
VRQVYTPPFFIAKVLSLPAPGRCPVQVHTRTRSSHVSSQELLEQAKGRPRSGAALGAVLRSRLVGMGNEDLALMDQDALLAEKERLLILQEKCRQTMLPLSRGKHREASPELAEQKREYDRIFGRLGVLEKLLAKGL